MFSGFFIAPVRLTIALFFLYRYVHALPLGSQSLNSAARFD